MARIWRAFPPEQMTKKSVKPAAFLKSRTTRPSAFLSSAARTARSTCFDGRVVLARRSRFVFSALAMQPACRRFRRSVGAAPIRKFRFVKSVLLNMLLHPGIDQPRDRPALRAQAAD